MNNIINFLKGINCKHKKVTYYEFKKYYNDLYLIEECNRCKKTRTIWQSKYFTPVFVDQWSKETLKDLHSLPIYKGEDKE